MSPPSRLHLRLITDGKIGDVVQVRGVAEAIAALRPADIEECPVHPRAIYAAFMPYGPPDPRDAPGFSPPFPDIAIASGRRAVASLRRLKKRSPTTFTAFMKDPRTGTGAADFIWVPAHDTLRGENVLVTSTSPHRLRAADLEAARQSLDPRLAERPSPRLAVLLGGPSNGFAYTDAAADRLAGLLRQSKANGFNLFVTPSRRTPDAFIARLAANLSGMDVFIWDRVSPNPYIALLANADRIIAPADSHNMVSEALAPGVPVSVFHPDGRGAKLSAFIRALNQDGLVSMFDAAPTIAPVKRGPGLDATATIVAALLRRFDAFQR